MKTLLLDAVYSPIAFLTEKKVIRHIVKGKVEVLSYWQGGSVRWISGKMEIPAVVRLKTYVEKHRKQPSANREAVIRRDGFICQYCGKACEPIELTIDHIFPQSRGGSKTSWTNVTTACWKCNNKKGNKTPEEAGMELLSAPFVPKHHLLCALSPNSPRHPDWSMYLGI